MHNILSCDKCVHGVELLTSDEMYVYVRVRVRVLVAIGSATATHGQQCKP